jgi:hypothetical protein
MILEAIATYGQMLVGTVLAGMLGLLWKDIREVRNGMGKYVKVEDCNDRRGTCASMREAVAQIVSDHSESLRTMQELYMRQSATLARLDERVVLLLSFKRDVKEVVDECTEDHSLPTG